MAFMKIRKSDGTLTDMLMFKGDPGQPGEAAKFSYGDTLPDTMEDGEVFFKTDGADYIVEQGTSGIWTYRKWNSGIAECWGNTSAISVDVTTPWGSMYYGQIGQVFNFPFEFIEVPVVSATAKSGGYAVMMMTHSTPLPTTTSTGMYNIIRPQSSTGVTLSLSFHVVGRWK